MEVGCLTQVNGTCQVRKAEGNSSKLGPVFTFRKLLDPVSFMCSGPTSFFSRPCQVQDTVQEPGLSEVYIDPNGAFDMPPHLKYFFSFYLLILGA